MSKANHIHKYKKVLLGAKKIVIDEHGKKSIVNSGSAKEAFRCILPGCNHKVMREEMEGREFICWECGGVGVINTSMLSLTKPRHFACRKKRKSNDEIKLNPEERLGLTV
jgi:hypothetical protein